MDCSLCFNFKLVCQSWCPSVGYDPLSDNLLTIHEGCFQDKISFRQYLTMVVLVGSSIYLSIILVVVSQCIFPKKGMFGFIIQ